MHLNLISAFYLVTLLPVTLSRTPHPCYYDANKPASDDLIPCYPSTLSSHYSCCRVGDKCLEQNACFDSDTQVTYQYGCTDASFQDPHCPQKCHLDTEESHWVGLVFCNGTRGLPKDKWLCHHPSNCAGKGGCDERAWDEGIERMWKTGCEDLKRGDEYVAFEASFTLSDIAALPSSSRLASYWSVNAERTKPLVTSTTASAHTTTASSGLSSSATASSTLTSTPTATSTPSAAPTAPASTRRRAATIGLGVGIGFGVPVLLGLAGLTLFYIRRQHKKHEAVLATLANEYPPEKGAAADSYAHNAEAGPGYAHTAELDSTPIVESCGSPTPSELPGSSVAATPYQSPIGSPEMVQGELNRKERMSVCVEEGRNAGVQEVPG
ncbi:uncharacterized protein K460DRAFT_126303 [Cucurbitaria berberidis CBS 394.84]|uniref:Mid2 domain-containing protein n=1 Tax=Cucurbitaria berberidis CBS 394.84 TaxID=1168544 RepID=A0A9P4GJ64_9PLEO|nr:uncharacterized protein K460DRAFT_126303 [Cucurbitaria berberidis CBS 394.84]KAF1846570.1 hypothetical protein K460DRAFT_126303 [Cucurbitaria berberidis CBS 394.84]